MPPLLHGTRFSLKDIFLIQGEAVSFGVIPPYIAEASETSPIIEKIQRAGSVYGGRVGLTPFAIGGENRNPFLGAVRSRREPARRVCGSSTGSAVSVFDGDVHFSLCSDSGGSARVPAASLDLVGCRFSTREVPPEGMLSVCPALDSVGVITRDIELVEKIYKTLTRSSSAGSFVRAPKVVWWDSLSKSQRTILEALSVKAHEVRRNLIEQVLPEIVSRWNGDKDALPSEIRALLKQKGTRMIDCERESFREEYLDALHDVDVLVTPCLGNEVGEFRSEFLRMNHYLTLANVADFPSLSVPFTPPGSGIFSVQLVGPDMNNVLNAAKNLRRTEKSY